MKLRSLLVSRLDILFLVSDKVAADLRQPHPRPPVIKLQPVDLLNYLGRLLDHLTQLGGQGEQLLAGCFAYFIDLIFALFHYGNGILNNAINIVYPIVHVRIDPLSTRSSHSTISYNYMPASSSFNGNNS